MKWINGWRDSMICDTTFVVDLLRKNAKAVVKLDELLRATDPQTTVLTVFELYSGLTRAGSTGAEEERVLQVLAQIPVVGLDHAAAKRGGKIDGDLLSAGKDIGPIDTLIAGIALARGKSLLTRNVRHFSRISGLQVETY